MQETITALKRQKSCCRSERSRCTFPLGLVLILKTRLKWVRLYERLHSYSLYRTGY